MKELHATAVVDSRGELTLKLLTDLAPGEHQLTLLVDENGNSDLETVKAATVRQLLSAFTEDWDQTEMQVYDRL